MMMLRHCLKNGAISQVVASGPGSEHEATQAKLCKKSEPLPLVPDVPAVKQQQPVVIEKPWLRKLVRQRDPWHWVGQLSGDVTSLPRFRDEVVRDLEKTNFAEEAIVFDLVNSKLASSILSHAELCIRSISSKHPALYKIGVTRNPVQRWLHTGYGYKLDRHVQWERMTVLHAHCNADIIGLLEAALIRIFFNAPGCRNIRLGGEGMGRAELRTFLLLRRPVYSCPTEGLAQAGACQLCVQMLVSLPA